MSMFHRIFRAGKGHAPEEDLSSIVKTIGPILNRTAQEIFKAHAIKLLGEPVDYIIPAVWGSKLNGQLDSTQQEIYLKVLSVLQVIFKALSLPGLSGPQEFALGFLLRETIISKTLFTIEMARNKKINRICETENVSSSIEAMETMGNA